MQKLFKTHHTYIDKTRIHIDREALLKLLGEQEGMIGVHTTELMEKYIGECLRVSSPEGAYVLTEVLDAPSADEISIPGLVFDSGKIIHNMLRHSDYYALFLVTAGPEPETLARTLLNEGNYLEGYITDMVASALVDSAADQMQELIRDLANKHSLQISNRYSPGYCSWKVEEQQKLFSLFPEGSCGIALSESSLMNPVKSISGIIGLGANVKYRDYTCELCSMTNCQYRKLRDQ